MAALATVSSVVALAGGLLSAQCAWARDASPTSALVRGEIAALLLVVETGGCAFMRNGTWHSASDARKMLDHKLNAALREPAGVPTSEHFIQKLASRSSMSGKPYLVRCGDTPPMESGPWLMLRLAELRASKSSSPVPERVPNR